MDQEEAEKLHNKATICQEKMDVLKLGPKGKEAALQYDQDCCRRHDHNVDYFTLQPLLSYVLSKYTIPKPAP